MMLSLFLNTVKNMFSSAELKTDNVVLDETAPVTKKTKKELEALTKKQLEEFGREIGIELDRRLLKSKLVTQLVSEQRKIKGE